VCGTKEHSNSNPYASDNMYLSVESIPSPLDIVIPQKPASLLSDVMLVMGGSRLKAPLDRPPPSNG
jgi:hypothetical protein